MPWSAPKRTLIYLIPFDPICKHFYRRRVCDYPLCRCGMGVHYCVSLYSTQSRGPADFCCNPRVTGSLAVWSPGHRQFFGQLQAETLVAALCIGVTTLALVPSFLLSLPPFPTALSLLPPYTSQRSVYNGVLWWGMYIRWLWAAEEGVCERQEEALLLHVPQDRWGN